MLFLHLADHVSLFSWFCFSCNEMMKELTSLLSAVPFCQSVILEGLDPKPFYLCLAALL